MKIKRLIAGYVDFIAIMLSVSLLVDIITNGYFNPDAPLPLLLFEILIYLVFIYLAFISKDILFLNASLGKKLMGLEILDSNNEIPPKKILIKRNSVVVLSFPFEIFNIIFSGYTTGDKKYKTIVVQVKKH